MADSPDDVFNLFKKSDDSNITLKELADSLNLEIDDLYDLSLDQITELSVKLADQNSERMQGLLDARNEAYGVVRREQRDAGITNSDLSKVYFEQLKRGE